MTPAIDQARKAGISFRVHEYVHDPRAEEYGLEAAQALGLDPERVFKTLLVTLDGDRKRLAVGIVPVQRLLNLKLIAKALRAKTAEMAEPKDAERATGYTVGGISPLGQKKLLPTVLDESALGFSTIYVSGGRRGLDLELSVGDLVKLCKGSTAPIARER
jgi:Cys-tRNA(Pro)/Cys-tRNA(Cys) deacylase